MTTPSNLYAEKVFSEHPMGLWTMDEDVNYLSLLSKEGKAMYGWSISGASKTLEIPSGVLTPVESSYFINVLSDDTDEVIIKSNNLINIKELDQDSETFNIGMYFNSQTNAISSVELGYEYGSEESLVEVLESFNFSNDSIWTFLSKSFLIPDINDQIRIVIKIKTVVSGSYNFYINNLSFGQWSEAFNTKNSGVVPNLLPTNIYNEEDSYGVLSSAYGISSQNAYYVSSQNKLYAFNEGFPIVYGSSSITKIVPRPNEKPSMLIPGLGFLNDSGRFQELTAEFWIKIKNKSYQARKIFGPIASNDGLYVDGAFLTLKIDKSIGSYFVGEWGRPMLLSITYSNNSASLMVNGESVISLDIDSSTISLPEFSDNSNKVKDWLGFYAYEDVPSLEIDCFAIYSYIVPEIVSKRRFVYGQGVEFPETSSSAFGGSSTSIDYRVANYSNNYMYPDMGKWSQGIFENISVENNTLSPTTYSLPEIFLANKNISVEEWLQLCSEDSTGELVGTLDISLADSEESSGGYLYFKRLNSLKQDTKAFYGVFKLTSEEDQVLFRVENPVKSETFTIMFKDGKISYTLDSQYSGTMSFVSEESVIIQDIFSVGIDIDKFSKFYGGSIARFFGSSNRLELYVGGQKNLEDTFSGKIYRVGISTKRNASKISDFILSDGRILAASSYGNIVDARNISEVVNDRVDGGLSETEIWQDLYDGGEVISSTTLFFLSHIASYTLSPRIYLGTFILDLATEGYWQDYIPLSYLGKVTTSIDGKKKSSLDYIQFNIDVPVIEKYTALGQYDTSDSEVKTFISFQYVDRGPNITDLNINNRRKLSKGKVVNPTSAAWIDTMYEVVDNTVIYLPPNVDFKKLAIVCHVQIMSRSNSVNKIKIKSIQYASRALEGNKPSPIATRLGSGVEPYLLRGIYPDYKGVNPVTIYKSGNPYLYLTNNSGIRLAGSFNNGQVRGLKIPINEQGGSPYLVGAMQGLAYYSEESFPQEPLEIFEINSKNKKLKGYIVAESESGKRGKIFVVNAKSFLPEPGINFYLNGTLVKDLVIKPREWNMIGMQSVIPIDFSSFSGNFSITGPMMINNFSNYRVSAQQNAITSVFRTWSQVPTMKIGDNIDPKVWGDFLTATPQVSWENILFIPSVKNYLIDPKEIYELYTGTNKKIVQDNSFLRFGRYAYRSYNGVRWQSNVLSAV
jgi:hypothetical protein